MKSIYTIVHTCCSLNWSGLEKRILNESLWMENNGHKIILITPEDSPLYLKAQEHGIEVLPVSFRFFSFFSNYRALKTIFVAKPLDIVNTHGPKDTWVGLLAAKAADVPLRILSQHAIKKVKISWFNKLLYKKFSHYIFTSNSNITLNIRKLFKLKDMRVFTMPNGIQNPDILMGREKARKKLCKKLELDSNARFIGFVGDLSKNKGLNTLLKAFHQALPSLANHHLVLVGNGTNAYLKTLRKTAISLDIDNQLHFIAAPDNTMECYRAFDCNTLPRINKRCDTVDGITHELFESVVYECPVLVPESNAIKETVDYDLGNNFFKPGDPDSLSERLLKTISRDGGKLPENEHEKLKETIRKNHSFEIMGRNAIRIYRLHEIRLDRSSPYLAHL